MYNFGKKRNQKAIALIGVILIIALIVTSVVAGFFV